ncbi:MAG TPA: hypothetical protein PLW37_07810, partial [bacterium]|nr:hypothetical protein [bacterium]
QDVDTPSMKNEAEERLIDAFIRNEPCADFFSNNFFYKAAHEAAVGFFKKEHFDWRIIDTLFFISAIIISLISIKLEIAFPSIFTVIGSTLIYYLNRLKNSVKPSADEQSGFSLFSYGVNMVISMIPVVLGTNFIAGLIILVFMVATVSSKVTGLDAVIRTQVPELPEEISAKYMSPSFFALVYLILVVLPVPFVVTAVTGAIFLLFHESGPKGMQK